MAHACVCVHDEWRELAVSFILSVSDFMFIPRLQVQHLMMMILGQPTKRSVTALLQLPLPFLKLTQSRRQYLHSQKLVQIWIQGNANLRLKVKEISMILINDFSNLCLTEWSAHTLSHPQFSSVNSKEIGQESFSWFRSEVHGPNNCYCVDDLYTAAIARFLQHSCEVPYQCLPIP